MTWTWPIAAFRHCAIVPLYVLTVLLLDAGCCWMFLVVLLKAMVTLSIIEPCVHDLCNAAWFFPLSVLSFLPALTLSLSLFSKLSKLGHFSPNSLSALKGSFFTVQ